MEADGCKQDVRDADTQWQQATHTQTQTAYPVGYVDIAQTRILSVYKQSNADMQMQSRTENNNKRKDLQMNIVAQSIATAQHIRSVHTDLSTKHFPLAH